jgi:hypothetical protein
VVPTLRSSINTFAGAVPVLLDVNRVRHDPLNGVAHPVNVAGGSAFAASNNEVSLLSVVAEVPIALAAIARMWPFCTGNVKMPISSCVNSPGMARGTA